MRIHRPAITGSISATNLIVSGTITAEGVQVPHGTAVSSSFAQKSAVSSSFAQKSAVSSSFALKSAISGSFGNQSVGTADSPTFAGVTTTGTLTAQTVTAQQFHTTIVSSSILYQSGSTKFGDSSDDIHQFTGSLHLVNSGSVSGSSVSTGSFGHVMKGGVNWDSAVSTSAASEGFTASPAITAIASTAANQLLTDDGDGTATSEANLTFDGTHLTLGGTSGSIILPAGGGINFAAQIGDAGGMTKELLDDYEEGTWTAVLSDGTNPMTMSSDTGYYTKVGNLVTVTGLFETTSIGSTSGGIRITGLPFTIANGYANFSGGGAAYGGGLAITAGHTVGYYGAMNDTSVRLLIWDDAAGVSSMTAAEWSNNGYIAINFSYRAA